MEIEAIIGDKAYSVQYIADVSQHSDYLPTAQEMISSLVIKNSIETGIGPVPNNSTKLYPDSCRPSNPGGWFHYNNTWEGKGMMEACTCDLGAWSCIT